MSENEGGKMPAIDDDRWVVCKGLVRAVACGVGAGLVMGVLYFLLAWLLQDRIRETEFGRTVYGRHYTPLVLLPFMLISLPLGWASLRLAERTSLLGGFVLMVPVVGSTVAASTIRIAVRTGARVRCSTPRGTV